MGDKHRGGRGHRVEKKYERFTVTLPPNLKAQLDAWATAAGLSRSEMLAQVIEERARATEGKQAATLPALPPPSPQEQDRAVFGEVSGPLTPYQAQLVEALRRGATLSRAPGSAWRLTQPGELERSVRGDSVQGLLDRGDLRRLGGDTSA
ncbi:ribbon-helix-helix protein, CopG family [Deinococcus sp. YIM 134068]|uniref:ribbon-helix-helix protein, CopG family n=1 Tax=Deinococcus lichenicola TaxID=3118910 RepID=UPI002F953059